MSDDFVHPVRLRRERVGVAQLALAESVGLARQSLSAIEAGRVTPSVEVALRLARALDCKVEDLFVLDDAVPTLVVPSLALPARTRVVVGRVGDAIVAHALDGEAGRSNLIAADGVVADAGRITGFGTFDAVDRTVFLAGCAPALGLLADRLCRNRDGFRYVHLPMSSSSALDALREGRVHVAGVHYGTADDAESNVAQVRRRVPARALVLTNLLLWDAGFALGPGNVRKLREPGDLGRRGVRFVTRDPGSAARKRFDRLAKSLGIDAAIAANVVGEASSVASAAAHVAFGAADAALTVASAARAAGVGFVPLATERFDLVVDRDAIGAPAIARMLDLLSGRAIRDEIAALGDDSAHTGRRAAEIER